MVELEIEGIKSSHKDFNYYVSMPACGGQFVVRGNKENENAKYTMVSMVHHQDHPECSFHTGATLHIPSDSRIPGDWWNIIYTLTEPPYEMIISIEPNSSGEERELEIRYGRGYDESYLKITQESE